MTQKTKILISILAVAIVLIGAWWIWDSQISEDDYFCKTNADCVVKLKQCLYKGQLPSQTEIIRIWADGEKCECIEHKCKKISCQDQGLVVVYDPVVYRFKCVEKQEQVTITTDKTEYEQGEIIKVTVENNLEEKICFETCTSYYFEKNIDTKWKKLLEEFCEINLVEECINSGESKIFEGKESFLMEKNEIYRVAVPICFDCEGANSFQLHKTIFSNEFTIKEGLVQSKDECDIGKDIVAGFERSNYNCEDMNNCEWRPLGCELEPFAGEKKCYFSCCPKNLRISELSDETRSIYGRCFLLID